MFDLDNSLDITKNIKIIEKLKSEILTSVSELYESLLKNNDPQRVEKLANLVVCTYLLSNRIGVSYENLDSKIINIVRLSFLEDSNLFKEDFAALLRHIEGE